MDRKGRKWMYIGMAKRVEREEGKWACAGIQEQLLSDPD